MSKSIQKNYSQISNKIRENFEDVKYLIALHNQVLEQIKLLNKRVDRMQNSIDSTYED